LLHYHHSLDKWVQLGGHLEKKESIREAVLRKAEEESGLNSLSVLEKNIFNLDVHKIPEFEVQVEHFHYDLRILLEADAEEKLERSGESKNMKWIDLNEMKKYISEESVLRMLRKTEPHRSV